MTHNSSQRGFTPLEASRANANGKSLSKMNDREVDKLLTGFTLIETLIALALILMALVGPVSLIIRGIYSFSSSKSKVIAVNLAQEGIELVRLIRENNVACDSVNGAASWSWSRNSFPPAGPGTTMNGTFGVDIQSFTDIHCPTGSQNISTPQLSASCANPLRFNPSTGTYSYSGGNPTTFFRCVEIKSPPDSPDTDIPVDEQMDVISTITWTERGSARILSLRERLYHWE